MPVLKATTLVAYEPARQFDFDIKIYDIAGSKDVTLSVESGFLPNVTNEEIELPFFNSRIWVAGKASYETGTLTVRDFIDQQVASNIWNWYQRVYNSVSGYLGRQTEYKKKADITTYKVGLTEGAIAASKWKISGVWPTAVNFGTLDYTANDIVKIELTLRYEDVQKTT